MKKIEKIKLPIVNDPRGNLTFIESQKHIPFNIERVFWIYDVPGNWDKDRCEAFVDEQGHHLSNSDFGMFDGEVMDLRDE